MYELTKSETSRERETLNNRLLAAQAEEAELRNKRDKALIEKELKQEDGFTKVASSVGKALLKGTKDVVSWAAEGERKRRNRVRMTSEKELDLRSQGYGKDYFGR